MASGNPEIIYGVQLLDDLHNYFPDLLYNNQRFTTVQSVLQYMTRSTRRRFDLFSYGRTQYNNSRQNIINQQDSDSKTDDEDEDEDDEDDDDEVQNNETQSNVQVVIETIRTPTSRRVPPAAASAQQTTGSTTASARGSSPAPPHVTQPHSAIPPRVNRTYSSVLAGSQRQSLYSLLPQFDSLIYSTLPPNQQVPDNIDHIDANISLLSAIAGLFPAGGTQLPRSFLDPVPIFPTPAQIQASTSIRTLDSDLEDNCSICQDTMRNGESIRRITVCNHTFHRSCIDTWFVRNVRCPVCRHDIREMNTAQAPVASNNIDNISNNISNNITNNTQTGSSSGSLNMDELE